MRFSIIIPSYNGSSRIEYCLKSIRNQNFPMEDYEVIVVDDFSDVELKPHIDLLCADYPSNFNIQVIRCPFNSKRGGALNLGFKMASGEYLLNIDDDDAFTPDALQLISEDIDKKAPDVLMFDSYDCIDGRINKKLSFNSNDIDVHTGKSFLTHQAVSWTTWRYAIKRIFLIDNNILFENNVLYEDVDFSLSCVALSERISYAPIPAILYTIREGQLSKIGTSKSKVADLFRLADRIKKVSSQFSDNRKELIKNHYYFQIHVIISRYLWRLKRKEIIELLSEFNSYETYNSKISNFSFRYPATFAFLSSTIAPLLNLALRIRKKLK